MTSSFAIITLSAKREMNINPAALNVIATAKEIGLFAGQLSANLPSLPLDDVIDGVVVAAATATATSTTTATSSATGSASSTAKVNDTVDGVFAASASSTAGSVTASTFAGGNGSGDGVIGCADIDGGAADSIVSVQGFIIEGIDDGSPHVKRHTVAFYNWLIPKFQEASAQYFVIKRAKYYKNIYSLKHVQGGESLSSLQPLFPNIHHWWNKKYSILSDSIGSHTLVSRPDIILLDCNVDTNNLKRIT